MGGSIGCGIGGGVGILFKTSYKYYNCKRINLDYSEGLSIDFYLHNSIKFSLFLIYRPPRFSIDDIHIFPNEFYDIITSTKSNDYILIGDLNFHYDTDIHLHSLFINLIDSFSLIQHITFPTHYIGHILDLVVTPIYNMLSKPPICLP